MIFDWNANLFVVIGSKLQEHSRIEEQKDKYTMCMCYVLHFLSENSIKLYYAFIHSFIHIDKNLGESHINGSNIWIGFSIIQNFQTFESSIRNLKFIKMKLLVVLVIVSCAVGYIEVLNSQ